MISSSSSTYEPPQLDAYGQGIIPFVWYNPMSWDKKWQMTSFGLGIGAVGQWASNYVQRRPIYASIHVGVAAVVGCGLAGYGLGIIFERKTSGRDAIIKHYMELHPEDFGTMAATQRHFKDVLLPWRPTRGLEFPIPWKKKSEWAEANEK